MRFDILSLFPEYFESPFNVSMIKRAREKKFVDINLINIRDFANDKHRKVDDRPYGGGPGMVMKPEPVAKAIRSVKKEDSLVIYLTPQGKLLEAKDCEELAKQSHLILLCGHYEGIDERVIEKEVNKEFSIGSYVLTNGCLAAIVLVDAVCRFIPGVLGHERAAQEDSFQNGLLGAPTYTKPEIFEGEPVPEVLKSGNHSEIRKWLHSAALKKTYKTRPDLGEKYEK